jgi:diaminopimelate decarboxylase
MALGRDIAQALISAHGSPLYVYEAAVLKARAGRLRRSIGRGGVRWFFAAKANGNRELLKLLRAEGWGVDAVSIGEVEAARAAGFTPAEITYNGNNVTDDELRAVAAHGVHISVDGLPQLRRVAALKLAPTVGLRLNPDVGAGHHHHVIDARPGREVRRLLPKRTR